MVVVACRDCSPVAGDLGSAASGARQRPHLIGRRGDRDARAAGSAPASSAHEGAAALRAKMPRSKAPIAAVATVRRRFERLCNAHLLSLAAHQHEWVPDHRSFRGAVAKEW